MSVVKVKTKNGEMKWEVRVWCGGRGSRLLRRRFDRKSDADAFLEEHADRQKTAGATGIPIDDGIRTFSDEAKFWLEHKSESFSPTHVVRSKTILSQVLPMYGNYSASRFHPGLLTQIQSAELARGSMPATVNRKIEVIKAILAFSTRCRRIPNNPATGFQKLKAVRQGISFWEECEGKAFLSYANHRYPRGSAQRWIFCVYLLALNTGIRGGEIWGLKAKDIVQDGTLIHIQRQYDRLTKVFRCTKGKRPRYVPCNPDLLVELKDLIDREKISPDQTLFRRNNGEPICHELFFRQYFVKDVKAAGNRLIRFHDLRHTATTLMIAKGLDIKTVQEICGHKSITTTMEYVHLLGDRVKDAWKIFSIAPSQGSVEIPNESQISPVKSHEGIPNKNGGLPASVQPCMTSV